MSEGGELVHFHDWRAARDRKAATRRRRLCRPPTPGFKRLAIACRGARIPRAPPGKSECDQQDAHSDSP